jgi:hypothetical protein
VTRSSSVLVTRLAVRPRYKWRKRRVASRNCLPGAHEPHTARAQIWSAAVNFGTEKQH